MPINVEEARLAVGILERANWEIRSVQVTPKNEANIAFVEITTRPPGGKVRTLKREAQFIQDAARAAVDAYVKENE